MSEWKTGVYEAAKAVMDLLPEEKRNARTFEDETLKRLSQPGAHPALKDAHGAFVRAVNKAWEASLPAVEGVVAHYRRTHRKERWIPEEEMYGEAVMKLRGAIVAFALSTTNRLPFSVFAARRLHEALRYYVHWRSEPATLHGRRQERVAALREGAGTAVEDVTEENGGLFASPEDELVAFENVTGGSAFEMLRRRDGEYVESEDPDYHRDAPTPGRRSE